MGISGDQNRHNFSFTHQMHAHSVKRGEAVTLASRNAFS